LELIAKQNTIKAPEVINYFTFANHQVLLLEWIESGTKTTEFWKRFGEQLAQLHSVNNQEFGLHEDNYMGSVKQINKWKINWVDFFRENRLEPLVIECVNQHLLTKKHQQQFENVYQKLFELFPEETPSLVHGDLWSGNFMCNAHAQPVLIDPAVYYGHRSVDLAMTTLFGGFDKGFYDSYNYNFPFPKNYKEQWEICNLYPLLIHLLLFGRSYLPQIQKTLNGFT
jgi:fructosamine-3-kinase